MTATTDDLIVPLAARNASLHDLAALLQNQQTAKHDVVAPSGALRFRDGLLVLDGIRHPLTAVADGHLADRLGIPVKYVRRLRDERPDLLDANLNGWLQGWRSGIEQHRRGAVAGPDARSHLVRTFRGVPSDDGIARNEPTGIARAFLSDGYRMIDHLDVVTAALEGVKDAGVETVIDGCDLTERRMQVRLACPDLAVAAPELLRAYRSPWDQGADRIEPWDTAAGRAHGWLPPDRQPVIHAGLVITNSETGGGAATITPRLVVQVCRNGLTRTADALRNVHLGARLEEGVIQWSDRTQQANLELVTAQARDAVTSFLDIEYVRRAVQQMEAAAGVAVTDPEATIRHVAASLRISEERRLDVLTHFILAGQPTAGGVMQAVSSVAQTVHDPDEALDLEGFAVRALDLAAAHAAG